MNKFCLNLFDSCVLSFSAWLNVRAISKDITLIQLNWARKKKCRITATEVQRFTLGNAAVMGVSYYEQLQVWDTEEQKQFGCNEMRLIESGITRSEQLLRVAYRTFVFFFIWNTRKTDFSDLVPPHYPLQPVQTHLIFPTNSCRSYGGCCWCLWDVWCSAGCINSTWLFWDMSVPCALLSQIPSVTVVYTRHEILWALATISFPSLY